MKDFTKGAFRAGCCAFAAAVLLPNIAQAGSLAGLSLAAASVQALPATDVEDIGPETVHYRRHRHYHGHCLASFYRCFYGDSPRYYYPSYRDRLDAYTYFYPPIYW